MCVCLVIKIICLFSKKILTKHKTHLTVSSMVDRPLTALLTYHCSQVYMLVLCLSIKRFCLFSVCALRFITILCVLFFIMAKSRNQMKNLLLTLNGGYINNVLTIVLVKKVRVVDTRVCITF